MGWARERRAACVPAVPKLLAPVGPAPGAGGGHLVPELVVDGPSQGEASNSFSAGPRLAPAVPRFPRWVLSSSTGCASQNAKEKEGGCPQLQTPEWRHGAGLEGTHGCPGLEGVAPWKGTRAKFPPRELLWGSCGVSSPPGCRLAPLLPVGWGLNGHPLLPAVACPQGDEHFCLRKIIIIIN